MSTLPAGAPLDPGLHAFRRERRRLAWLDRSLLLTGLGFIAWVIVQVMIIERRDTFYILPSVFGTITGLSRYLVHRVRALPIPVRDLRHPDAATRDRAWVVVDTHRDELLAATDLPATIHEPPLTALSRDALVERVARAGDTDWRRMLRGWLYVWAPLALAVLLACLLYQPAPLVPGR